MLGPRLQTAFELYRSCELAADIGTDHARLPAALMRSGKCRRMILSDISDSALASARSTISFFGLKDQCDLRLGDGLSVLQEKCGMISVLGMGGRNIQEILMAGQDRLQRAELLLSAHSNLPKVRQAVSDIGYHAVSETLCMEDGRFYLMLHAVPGEVRLTPREIRLGTCLFSSESPLLLPYLRHQREILESMLPGLKNAKNPDHEEIQMILGDIEIYRKEEEKHDRT